MQRVALSAPSLSADGNYLTYLGYYDCIPIKRHGRQREVGRRRDVDNVGRQREDNVGRQTDVDNVGRQRDVDNVGRQRDVDNVGRQRDVDNIGRQRDVDNVGRQRDVDNVGRQRDVSGQKPAPVLVACLCALYTAHSNVGEPMRACTMPVCVLSEQTTVWTKKFARVNK
jgi:hypothetical protein